MRSTLYPSRMASVGDDGTEGWAVCHPVSSEDISQPCPESAAAAPAPAGTPSTPHGPAATGASAEKQASQTPATAAKAPAISHKVLQLLVEAMLVFQETGRIPRPGESASARARFDLGVPGKEDVRSEFVVETPPEADLFQALLASEQSKFRNRDVKEIAKALTSMSSAQHRKLSAAGERAKAGGEKEDAQAQIALFQALQAGLPMKKNRKTPLIYYWAGEQPCRWNGVVVVGVGYFRAGHPRDEQPFKAHFAAFQAFVKEAYTADAHRAFEALELEEQMNLFEKELKALHAAYQPWTTGIDFPTTLHPVQQAHRVAKARVPMDAQQASNTRTRDDKVLEAANLAATNVHAEMMVSTAVAVGDALMENDHSLYDFFRAVKRTMDRLKLGTPSTESNQMSSTAASTHEDAMDTD